MGAWLILQAKGVLPTAVLATGLFAATVPQLNMALAQDSGGSAAVCIGDCNGDGEVTVNELITMVNIALGTADVSACTAGDANGDGQIFINEIISGVNNALNGCPPDGAPACGNGTREGEEECDNGGICIGGSNAGTACSKEEDCQGDGVCLDGPKANRACATNTDCASSTCVHCRPFGGDGCAANCTNESNVLVTLKAGELTEDELGIIAGTSGLVVHGDILTIPLPFPPDGSITLTIGKDRDGKVPGVVKAASVNYPRIPVQTLACTCLRGAELKTCGGTMMNADGTPTTDCSTAGDGACAGQNPCTSVFGLGNSAAGTVGCSTLEGVNLVVTQDSGGTGPPSPPVVELTGTGDPGSAVLHTATSLGFVIGACADTGPDYGPDGEFCTDDDPQSSRGAILPATQVTGTASATMTRANETPDTTIGPHKTKGAPLACSALASGSASGGNLAGAFTMLDAPTIIDVVVTTNFVAQ